jgi:CIC family chloride channel protein
VIRLREGWRLMRKRGPSQFQFWVIALLVGIAAGFAAVAFRKGIAALEGLLYQTGDVARLQSLAEHLPWYWVLLIPVAGGLVVGQILHRARSPM